MSRRSETSELDEAIGHIRADFVDQPQKMRRSGIVPISEQVLGVGRVTADAYQELKQQVEAWQQQGALIVEVEPAQIRDTQWRDRDERGSSDEAFAQLRDSIASDGQITPVALRRCGDAYEVVFGHRRVAVCRSLARTVRAVVVDTDERGLVSRMLIENAQRKDLSPIERAIQYRKLLAAELMDRVEIARLLGVTAQQVSNVLALAELPADVLEHLGDARTISIATGKRLLAAVRAHGERVAEALATTRESRGDATARAQELLRLLEGQIAAGGEQMGRLIRAKDGRRFARLSRSGNQLVVRFQPDLDEATVLRLAHKLPELYAQEVGEQRASE